MADQQLVNVIDPDTQEVGSIPQHQLTDALNQGFTQASPDQVNAFMKEQKYGTTEQQFKTAAEGALSAATFGAGPAIEQYLGDVKPEDIRNRRETNPGVHALGEGVGIGTSSLLAPEISAASILERTGAAAAEKLLPAIAEQGLARTAGRAAIKGAVENMMVSGGDEIGKMFTADPNQSTSDALETAAADIGLSGIIGGAIGGGLGSVSPLWESAFGKKTEGLINDVTNEAHNFNAVKSAQDSGVGVTPLDEDYFQRGFVNKGINELKPNSEDIAGAAERLKIKPTVGTMSNAQFVQDMENNLSKSPTPVGHAIAKENEAIYDKLNRTALQTLNGATNKTEAQVGKEIKEGLHTALSEEYAPIKQKYEELKPHFQNMEVTDAMKKGAIDGLMSSDLVAAAAPESDTGKMAAQLAKEISYIKNVDQLKSARTLINDRLSKAYRTGGEEIGILQEAKNQLNSLRENAIKRASESTGIGKRAAGEISSATISDIRETDAAYRELKNKLLQTGTEAGLGKIGSVNKLLEKFTKLSDESFARRIFDTNDINQLNYFKENFPKQFELARQFKLGEIKDASMNYAQGKNGRFEIGRYLRQTRDLSPEAKEILFSGQHQKMNDINTIYMAMPGNANPSGTAAAIAHAHMFSPQGLIDTAADAVKYAVLKGIPYLQQATGSTEAKAVGIATMKALQSDQPISGSGFKAAVDFIKHTINGENALGKASKAVFKAGVQVLPQTISDTKRKKLDETLKDYQTDQEPMLALGKNTGHYLPEQAQNIGSLSANAVNYLNGLRPPNGKNAPLDTEIKPSKSQTAEFNRALDIAEQPLLVMNHIKAGTITPKDIVTLKTIYPALYQRMSHKLMDGIVSIQAKNMAIPYKTRIGLSMFMGQPLDSTMTPQGIMAAQPKPNVAPSQQMGMPQHHAKHSMNALSKMAPRWATQSQAREMSRVGH